MNTAKDESTIHNQMWLFLSLCQAHVRKYETYKRFLRILWYDHPQKPRWQIHANGKTNYYFLIFPLFIK